MPPEQLQNNLSPYLNGVASSGTAVIQGVTYKWDSLIVQLNLGVIGAYSNWVQKNFTIEKLSDSLFVSPQTTTSSRGLSNLLKYFFGINPSRNVYSAPLTLGVAADSGEGSNFVLTFPQAQNMTDTSYSVQSSDTLHNDWVDVGFQEVSRIQGVGVDAVTVKILNSNKNVAKRFYRINVNLTDAN